MVRRATACVCVWVCEDRGAHLGVLEHAQVGVHAQGPGLVAGALVQLGGVVELALVGVHVGQEELVVALASLLPLLQGVTEGGSHRHRRLGKRQAPI